MNSTVAAAGQTSPANTDPHPAAKWLERSLFALIFLVALFAPVWTKAAVLFFRVALVVWIAKLLWLRPKLPSLSIARPLLAYLLLVFASTLFSPLPILSWGRMRTTELLLLALVVACNLRRSGQFKALVLALTCSTMVAVGYAGWTQLRGIGVKLEQPAPAGLGAADVIVAVNGNKIRDPEDWRRALAAATEPAVHLAILRGDPGTPVAVTLPRGELVDPQSQKAAGVALARPQRARGFFYSYIPFAEILLLMSLVAFGLCIGAAQARKPAPATAWAIVFAIFAAALVATETRSAVAAVLVVSVAAVCLVGGWKLRVAGVAALVLLIIAGAFWFRAERGFGWLGARDPGTDYRLLMWKDGARLALEHPLLGIGMDTVERRGEELHIAAYRKYPNLKSHFHSTYIQIAAECGLPALGAWIWVLAAILATLWRKRLAALPIERGLMLGVLAGVTAFAMASALHYTLGDAEVMVLFWLLVGMAASPSVVDRTSPSAAAL